MVEYNVEENNDKLFLIDEEGELEFKSPNCLEWVLAFTPIPIIGEYGAEKVAAYITQKPEIDSRGVPTPFSALVMTIRGVSYIGAALGTILYYTNK